MKKICFLIIMILLFPMFVYAEDNDLVLKSITLDKLSKDVEELSLATIENNKINLDLKMYEVGDTAEYIVTIENPTDKDLYLEQNIVNTDSTYFDYELLGVDKSTVIEKNSEKGFLLKVKYHTEVAKENFFSAKYNDTSSLAFMFNNNSLNPETKRNILLLLIVIGATFLAFKYNKKNKLIILLLLMGIIPYATIAKNDYHIGINSKILVKKVKPNPCTFDGELTQGAEYTNGQYTYRYMQEGNGSNWQNIENDGWGVILTDKDSEEDVTTKLCTSINDKPIVSMRHMFYNSKASNIDLSSFDTSNVVSMGYMFWQVQSPEEYDLSSFDTSNVKTMAGMFAGNLSLESIDLHYFDTSNVTSMSYMFVLATLLKSIDLSNFDTSNVTNMVSMFNGASSLKSIDLSNFDTSKVINMGSMFSGTSSLEEVNLDGFELTGSTIVGSGGNIISGMFSAANNLKKVSMKNWKLPENFSHVMGCRYSSLCSQNLEYIDVTGWDLSGTTNLEGLFADSKAKEIRGLNTWDTSKVTNMGLMFYGASSLKSIDLSNFDTSKVIDMTSMFNGASNLETIKVNDKFVTGQVTNSDSMFSGATSLVGGNGTVYDANHIDKEYARIDAPGTPGYFTGVS